MDHKITHIDYDKICNAYSQYGEAAITDWILGYANVVKIISPLENKIILDYGCGNGKFARHIASNCKKVIGVDTSFQMIEEANSWNSENIEYQQIESGVLDFIPSNSVDGVVLNFVTCTVNSKNSLLDIFQNLGRVLIPGATLVLLDVNWKYSNGRDFISFKLEPNPNLLSGDKIYVDLKIPGIRLVDYYWSPEDYISLLEESGLEFESIETPLAPDDDLIPWIDERDFAPFELICARKKN